MSGSASADSASWVSPGDGEDYYVQYLPVGMQELACPPELMLAQMTYAAVDHCILQAGGGYGAMNDYNAFTQHQYPQKFSGLLNIDEAARRSRRHAGRSRSRSQFPGAARPLLRAGFLASRLFAQRESSGFRRVLGQDRRLSVARFHRALVHAELMTVQATSRICWRSTNCWCVIPAHRFLLVMGPPVGPLRGLRPVGVSAGSAHRLQARQSANRDHVSDLVGWRLGLSVSRGAAAHPRPARYLRRVEAHMGLGYAQRRALLHLSAVCRLRQESTAAS